MRIHVYCVCRNEETLLPYFLRHYGSFAERIVVFDDSSTDRSRDILAAHPKVACFQAAGVATDQSGKLSDGLLLRTKNEAYKASRGVADWVMVVDVDEFIYHPRLVPLLEEYLRLGVTVPDVCGFDMVSDHPPGSEGQIYEEIRSGFENRSFSKSAVFTPEVEINYSHGCHSSAPGGDVVGVEQADLKLLHYRFLGREYFSARYMLRQGRMSEENLANSWGTHLSVPTAAGSRPLYPATGEDLKRRYDELMTQVTLSDVVEGSLGRERTSPPRPRRIWTGSFRLT